MPSTRSGTAIAKQTKRVTRANGKARIAPISNARSKDIPTPSGNGQIKQSAVSDSGGINASPAHIPVTPQQSAEIVKTFLFSAVSTILWSRDLLPNDYFRTVFYASVHEDCSYHDFTSSDADEILNSTGTRRQKGYYLQVLRRERSSRADLIIKWLEAGAFDAIQRGYLDQLQITILTDDDDPKNVLELYCFRFQYSSAEDDSTVTNVHLESSKSKTMVSLRDLREALNYVIKNLVALHRGMPCLPDLCFMVPYLIWNERRPRGYQPPGFQPSDDDSISFPATDGWDTKIGSCGEIKGHSEAVNLSVAYVTKTGATNGGETPIPNVELNYRAACSRLGPLTPNDISIDDDDERGPQGDNDVSTVQPPSDAGEDTVKLPAANPVHGPVEQPDIESTARLDATVDTQDRADLQRLRALQPVEPTQTHDTQVVVRPTSLPLQGEASTAASQVMGEETDSAQGHGERSEQTRMADKVRGEQTSGALKRKDHPSSPNEGSPKTPRLSRPRKSIAFNAKDPFTPKAGAR